jgi:hypothetical protein
MKVPSEAEVELALRELHVIIALTPIEIKAGYIEALEKCPRLIRTESDPISFLRREDFNPKAASVRLFNYWSMRIEAFQERAFRPMSMGPEGALIQEDINNIKSGAVCLLGKNSRGESVISMNFSRIVVPPAESRMRILFFLNNLFTNDAKVHAEGAVMLLFINKLSIGMIPKVSPQPQIIIKKALPSRIKRIFMVYCPEEGVVVDKADFFVNMLPATINFFAGALGHEIVPVCENSREEAIAVLKEAGFERHHLPRSMGGTWDDTDFMDLLVSKGLAVENSTGSDSSEQLERKRPGLDALDSRSKRGRTTSTAEVAAPVPMQRK